MRTNTHRYFFSKELVDKGMIDKGGVAAAAETASNSEETAAAFTAHHSSKIANRTALSSNRESLQWQEEKPSYAFFNPGDYFHYDVLFDESLHEDPALDTSMLSAAVNKHTRMWYARYGNRPPGRTPWRRYGWGVKRSLEDEAGRMAGADTSAPGQETKVRSVSARPGISLPSVKLPLPAAPGLPPLPAAPAATRPFKHMPVELWDTYVSVPIPRMCLEALAQGIIDLRPRTVHDLKPMLILCQGLLKDLLADCLALGNQREEEMKEELQEMQHAVDAGSAEREELRSAVEALTKKLGAVQENLNLQGLKTRRLQAAVEAKELELASMAARSEQSEMLYQDCLRELQLLQESMAGTAREGAPPAVESLEEVVGADEASELQAELERLRQEAVLDGDVGPAEGASVDEDLDEMLAEMGVEAPSPSMSWMPGVGTAAAGDLAQLTGARAAAADVNANEPARRRSPRKRLGFGAVNVADLAEADDSFEESDAGELGGEGTETQATAAGALWPEEAGSDSTGGLPGSSVGGLDGNAVQQSVAGAARGGSGNNAAAAVGGAASAMQLQLPADGEAAVGSGQGLEAVGTSQQASPQLRAAAAEGGEGGQELAAGGTEAAAADLGSGQWSTGGGAAEPGSSSGGGAAGSEALHVDSGRDGSGAGPAAAGISGAAADAQLAEAGGGLDGRWAAEAVLGDGAAAAADRLAPAADSASASSAADTSWKGGGAASVQDAEAGGARDAAEGAPAAAGSAGTRLEGGEVSAPGSSGAAAGAGVAATPPGTPPGPQGDGGEGATVAGVATELGGVPPPGSAEAEAESAASAGLSDGHHAVVSGAAGSAVSSDGSQPRLGSPGKVVHRTAAESSGREFDGSGGEEGASGGLPSTPSAGRSSTPGQPSAAADESMLQTACAPTESCTEAIPGGAMLPDGGEVAGALQLQQLQGQADDVAAAGVWGQDGVRSSADAQAAEAATGFASPPVPGSPAMRADPATGDVHLHIAVASGEPGSALGGEPGSALGGEPGIAPDGERGSTPGGKPDSAPGGKPESAPGGRGSHDAASRDPAAKNLGGQQQHGVAGHDDMQQEPGAAGHLPELAGHPAAMAEVDLLAELEGAEPSELVLPEALAGPETASVECQTDLELMRTWYLEQEAKAGRVQAKSAAAPSPRADRAHGGKVEDESDILAPELLQHFQMLERAGAGDGGGNGRGGGAAAGVSSDAELKAKLVGHIRKMKNHSYDTLSAFLKKEAMQSFYEMRSYRVPPECAVVIMVAALVLLKDPICWSEMHEALEGTISLRAKPKPAIHLLWSQLQKVISPAFPRRLASINVNRIDQETNNTCQAARFILQQVSREEADNTSMAVAILYRYLNTHIKMHDLMWSTFVHLRVKRRWGAANKKFAGSAVADAFTLASMQVPKDDGSMGKGKAWGGSKGKK